jgi:hypothetical protein
VFAETALLNAKGAQLVAYSPGTYGYMFRHNAKVLERDHLEIDMPLRFDASDVKHHADRAARVLMLRAYESFGFEEEHLPAEWDRDTFEFTRAH